MTPLCPVESRPCATRGGRAAFTLLEMLVAVSILVIIIFGLYAMFAQTQKAFRNVAGQVDVFEGGRAAIELVSRDVAEAVAVGNVNYPHLDAYPNPAIQAGYALAYSDGTATGTNYFTNRLQNLYLTVRNGTAWEGHGYYVHTNLADRSIRTNGFGVLYRFQSSTNRINTNAPMVTAFYNANPGLPNSYVIADGVVHFTVRAFDSRGLEITNLVSAALSGDSLPAMVEVELGILEPDIAGEARAVPAGALPNYLARQAGKVHLFRQQIPIRSAAR